MKFLNKICLVLLIIAVGYNIFNTQSSFVVTQCLDDQKSLLLHLNTTLQYNTSESTKLGRWNDEGSDCCKWSGVECNPLTGHVIGLDLNNEGIYGPIPNSSTLFHLRFLQRLNLAYNYGISGHIPSAIGHLTCLTYLNLSDANFAGQVPLEISHLSNLVTLDISFNFGLYTQSNLLNHNLTNLRELQLDGVLVTTQGKKWWEVLSSSLPHLQILSMQGCNLTGEIHPSLANLHSLSTIQLDDNNFSIYVPELFAGFKNLTVLSLSGCGLFGTVLTKLFPVSTLTTLDLSGNENLGGTLPHSFFTNLRNLVTISLSRCNFQGSIPPLAANLSVLEYMYLSNNQFSGSIPSFSSATHLRKLYLDNNSLSGPITTTDWGSLLNIETLVLAQNLLNGSIPTPLLLLPSLTDLDLSHNKFTGQLNEFETLPSSKLSVLDMSNNNLEGLIPKSISQLTSLTHLFLSNNKFNGTLDISDFVYPLVNLSSLHLSHNSISILMKGNTSYHSFPQLKYLGLASCKLMVLPELFLKKLSNLISLDLSKNNLQGDILSTICKFKYLLMLDLEHNNLNGTIPDCLIAMTNNLMWITLRGNNLHGVIPNKFKKECELLSFKVDKNNLNGSIPRSLSNCELLNVVDLGYNGLNDTFPCHLQKLSSLQVLVLRSNKLHGTVDCSKIDSNWSSLQIMDLASNHFKGQLSSLFLGKWGAMKARTTGMQSSFKEHGFSFHETVVATFKGFVYELDNVFNIIDLSNNSFHGEIPTEIGNVIVLIALNLSYNFLSGNIPPSVGNMSDLESLDLSNNALSGKIPQQLASLNFLERLNLSYNKLSGEIPTGTQLQSFDPSSYEGNPGLHGPPLTPIPRAGRYAPKMEKPTPSNEESWSSESKLRWMLRGAEVGFPVGIITIIGPLLYIKSCRQCFCYHVDRLLMKVLQSKSNGRRKRRSKKGSKKPRQMRH